MQRDGDYIPFASSGAYPIRAGNRVQPLVDGEPAFRRICEAVEAAKKSVWVTVAFIDPDFEMPDGRGSLFDVLDRAQHAGLDVRVLFWRSTLLHSVSPGAHFCGTEEDFAFLVARESRFQARWDRAHDRYCQHQKCWLIDAGAPTEVGFVGGINLHRNSMVPPGHPATEGGNTHDVYVELEGPAVSDVHHNFVQRWNEASDRDEPDGLFPDALSQAPLAFPATVSREVGSVPMQIQRTVRRDHYTDSHATPGGVPFEIAKGEYSVVEQYLAAIGAARRTIYIEDQAIGSVEIVNALHAALERGVSVVFLVPIDPNGEMIAGRKRPESKPFFDSLAGLGKHKLFTLAGIATPDGKGGLQHVYVHAKIALIDDVWCTIGSANIGNRSFYGDTELNASFWDNESVRALRCALFEEHLVLDTSSLDDREALGRFHAIAAENERRHLAGEPMAGLALRLDPVTYAS